MNYSYCSAHFGTFIVNKSILLLIIIVIISIVPGAHEHRKVGWHSYYAPDSTENQLHVQLTQSQIKLSTYVNSSTCGQNSFTTITGI